MTNTARPVRPLYTREQLRGLFSPTSVAVVGASETKGSFGGRVFANLAGSAGVRATPVSPRGGSVFGSPVATSLSAIGEHVDWVAVCVKAELVPGVLTEAESLGIGNAVIFSSGFADSGSPEGRALQQELDVLARRGMRLLGPNCLGFIDFHRRVEAHFVKPFGGDIQAGGLGVVAQSGALGFLLTQAQYRGVGFSSWIAPGNSVDVDTLDAVNYLVDDPRTRAVIMVIESVTRGQELARLGARAAEAGKPLLVHKMGWSEGGAKASATHTGSIAGSDAVYRAAFRRAGIVQVDHFDELLEVAELFVKGGRPSARGVGVLSASGGAAILAADEADRASVPLPTPTKETSSELGALLPGFASVDNPTDLTGEAVKDPSMYGECVSVFRQDPNIGLVMAALTVAWEATTAPRAEALVRAAEAEENGAPLAAVWLSEWDSGPGRATLAASDRVPTFRSFRVAMRAARLWFDWADHVTPPVCEPDTTPLTDDQAADLRDRFVAARSTSSDSLVTLDELESKQVLATLGVDVVPSVRVQADDPDVDGQLAEIPFPVVVKVLSSEITHKARVGGVRLGLKDAPAALAAVNEIADHFARDGARAAVLVEPMVPARREWFVGGRRDPAFGPVLTIGRGGSGVESLSPVLILDAGGRASVEHALLGGVVDVCDVFRAEPWIAGRLAEVGAALAALLRSFPDVREIDVNPLIETGDKRLIAVDSVVVLDSD